MYPVGAVHRAVQHDRPARHVSIPAGLVDGMPVGLQVVARRLEDDLCVAAGAVLEADPPLAQVRPRLR